MAFGFVTIRRTKNRNAVRIKARREVIKLLGWGVLDDGTGDWGQAPSGGPYTGTRPYSRVAPWKGGVPMRISFDPDKFSTKPGMAFRFRVNKSTTNADLVQIAAATQGDWCWMTNFSGRRIDRAEWLALAQGGRLHRSNG